MALGTNLNFNVPRKRVLSLIMQNLGNKRFHGISQISRSNVCTKAGAPATNTAADNPGRKGVLCYDVTNSKTYVCSAYTNATTFTWTAMS